MRRHRNPTRLHLTAGGVLLVGFGFLALFGLSRSMTADEHGQMSGCPFMSKVPVVCPMGAQEHLERWQEAITGIIEKQGWVALMLWGAVVVFGALRRPRFDTVAKASAFSQRWKQERWRYKLFDFLTLAFAQGILHPKVF